MAPKRVRPVWQYVVGITLGIIIVFCLISPSHLPSDTRMDGASASVRWSELDWDSDRSLPEELGRVRLEDKTVNVMGIETFYRCAYPPSDVRPSGVNLLFLHGAAFNSETWKDLGSLQVMAALGHRVCAIDLPGASISLTQNMVDPKYRGDYLAQFMTDLSLKPAVVVVPSMSGTYAFPLLVKKPKEYFRGFVAVAPVMDKTLTSNSSLMRSITVPMLAVYGTKDLAGKSTSERLGLMLNSAVKAIEKGDHPAYLKDPLTFHALLKNFVKYVVAFGF